MRAVLLLKQRGNYRAKDVTKQPFLIIFLAPDQVGMKTNETFYERSLDFGARPPLLPISLFKLGFPVWIDSAALFDDFAK